MEEFSTFPLDRRLTGDGKRMLDYPQLICDAVLPRYEPERHWLGVYAANSVDASSFACLDRFALKDANNEICWFSPTHDGTSLSWRVSVESDRLGQRRAQVLDYSASGMKLALDGVSDLRPGAPLDIHYHRTGWCIRQQSPGQRKTTQRPSLVLGF